MSEQPSRDELIRGLAVLRLADPVAYGQERKAVAKKLGCGLRYLDQAVEAEARRLAVQGAAPKEEADPDELEAEGRVVLDSEDVLAALRPVLRHLGYAGSTAPVELVYLALHSRLLLRPLNLLLGGTSSAGKTFTLDMATWLHPPEALHDLTGASEKALIYMEGDFQHKYVAIAEASALQQDGLAASIVRSLAWGKGLTYSTVEKDATGRLVSRMIEKPGPTGLITTSTKGLEPELTTRLLEVPIPENVELTRQIMRSQAETAAGTAPPEPDRAPWIAAARWLEIAGRRHVVIPFARQLAEVVPADDVRLRRDFTQILTVISTHALIHQRTRDQDSQGRVVADIDDYEATRHLLVDVLAVTIDSIPETVRETIETVQAMLSQHPAGVTVVMLAERLGMSRQAALRRANTALKKRLLVNTEERRGRPFQLILGDALPERRVLLPSLTPEERLSGCHSLGGDNSTTALQKVERDAEPVPRTDNDPDDPGWEEEVP